MATKNKKIATAVTAVTLAVTMAVGGTYAWQSISQQALNEASDVINPGGRLHNDMWYVSAQENNNDIYVENFAEDDIYARVRLSEYMKIISNYGADNQDIVKSNQILGSKNDDGTYNYELFKFDGNVDENGVVSAGGANEDGEPYWSWQTGNEDSETVYYMPTFNKNKDSLAPDLNGLYRDRIGGISNRGEDQYIGTEVDAEGNPIAVTEGYADGDTLEGYEIFDADSDDIDDIGTDPLVIADIIKTGVGHDEAHNIVSYTTHNAEEVGTTRGLMSIDQWLAEVGYDATTGEAPAYDPDVHGNYWVYDEDGWVYWSGAIAGGEATGLLLDGTKLNQVMDDTWYYAIKAEGEFITADDLGEPYLPDADTDENGGATTYNLRTTSDIVDDGNGGNNSDDTIIEGGPAVPMPDDGNEGDDPIAQPEGTGGTGYYKNGITEEALALLSIIGVQVGDDEEGEVSGGGVAPKTVTLELTQDGRNTVEANIGDTIILTTTGLEEDLSNIFLDTWVDNEDWAFDGTAHTVAFYDETLVGKTMKIEDAVNWCYGFVTFVGVADGVGDDSGNGDDTGTEELETYLLLTESGSNSATVALGDKTKIKVDENIDYDVIRVYAQSEDDEEDSYYYEEDYHYELTEDNVLTINYSGSIGKKLFIRAETGEEITEVIDGEEYTYTQYTPVAYAQLTTMYKYSYYYNNAPIDKGIEIPVTVDELCEGIEITLWDNIENKELDSEDYASIENTLSYSIDDTFIDREFELFGGSYENNVLKITNASYDTKSEYELGYALTTGDKFLIEFDARRYNDEDESSTVMARTDFVIVITDDGRISSTDGELVELSTISLAIDGTANLELKKGNTYNLQDFSCSCGRYGEGEVLHYPLNARLYGNEFAPASIVRIDNGMTIISVDENEPNGTLVLTGECHGDPDGDSGHYYKVTITVSN